MKTFLILLLFIPASFCATGVTTPYSYNGATGPTFWGQLDEAYKNCTEGTTQSPINISDEEFKHFTKPDHVEFNDTNDAKAENKDHTIEVSTENKTLPAKMNIGEKVYELKQFHFHTPSEHRINGTHHDVEAHFVFMSENGELSVIGVFYDVSNESSAFLAPIIDNLPSEGSITDIGLIHLSSVLNDIDNMNQAYTYPGSLTTPPCTEGVTWWVAKPVLPISISQYIHLRNVMGFNSRFTC